MKFETTVAYLPRDACTTVESVGKSQTNAKDHLGVIRGKLNPVAGISATGVARHVDTGDNQRRYDRG